VLILKPTYTTARNDLGVVYLELKRWDNAIQQFQMVKDDIFYENSESAILNLGLAYLGKGDYPKALAELKLVIAANPRRLEARLTLGRILFAMDKTEQAINEYKKALDIYKDYGDAHYYLGLAYLKLNNVAAARTSFKEAVRIIPENERGRSALEYLELLK
jgi:tetratricopeptide (TPR) repeat protein